MLTLAGQIQRASDTSKLALERISGVAAPKMEDNEKTFAELFARVERTAAYHRRDPGDRSSTAPTANASN